MATRGIEEIGRELAAVEAAIRACGYLFRSEPDGAVEATQAPLLDRARKLVHEMNAVIEARQGA